VLALVDRAAADPRVEQGDDRPPDLALRSLVEEGAPDPAEVVELELEADPLLAAVERSVSFAVPSGSPPFGLTTCWPSMFAVIRVAPEASIGIVSAPTR
jgi:hypothetical protein